MKRLIVAILFNVLLFSLIHWIHFNFLPPKIIFTSGIIDIILACILGSIIVYISSRDSVLTTSAFLIVFFAAMTYISLIPTMVDRSITVFILLNLDQAGDQGIDIETIKGRLKNERIIDKRFEELEQLNIIKIQNDRAYLSAKGKLSADVFLYDMKALKLNKEYNNFTYYKSTPEVTSHEK